MYLPYNLTYTELLLPSPGKSITETTNFIINVRFKKVTPQDKKNPPPGYNN